MALPDNLSIPKGSYVATIPLFIPFIDMLGYGVINAATRIGSTVDNTCISYKDPNTGIVWSMIFSSQSAPDIDGFLIVTIVADNVPSNMYTAGFMTASAPFFASGNPFGANIPSNDLVLGKSVRYSGQGCITSRTSESIARESTNIQQSVNAQNKTILRQDWQAALQDIAIFAAAVVAIDYVVASGATTASASGATATSGGTAATAGTGTGAAAASAGGGILSTIGKDAIGLGLSAAERKVLSTSNGSITPATPGVSTQTTSTQVVDQCAGLSFFDKLICEFETILKDIGL